jgi:hypothetical protein
LRDLRPVIERISAQFSVSNGNRLTQPKVELELGLSLAKIRDQSLNMFPKFQKKEKSLKRWMGSNFNIVML